MKSNVGARLAVAAAIGAGIMISTGGGVQATVRRHHHHHPPPFVTACVGRTTQCSASSTTANVTTPATAPSCSGLAVAPGQLTQALFDANPPATTFCLSSGTFNVSSVLVPKSYDSIIGTGSQTVLDGNNTTDTAIRGYCCSTQLSVTISSLVVQHFIGATGSGGIRAATNWTITNVESRYNRVGIALNNGVTMEYSYLHDNTQYGLTTAGNGTKVLNNEIARNNTGNYDVGDAGGMKFWGRYTQNVLIQGNYFHDNIGNGIWCDTCGANIVITGNTSTNNTNAGIDLEVAISGTISKNVVTDDAAAAVAGKDCWWGSGIEVHTTPNVEVFGNTVTESNGADGICAIDAPRADAYGPLTNLYVHDNTVRLRSSGTSGVVGNATTTFSAAANNRFVNNTYYVPNVSGSYWAWNVYPITWSAWRTDGEDMTGQAYAW